MSYNDYLNRIKKSKDGKVLVENFAYLSLLQIASYLFPLITMPYLARVIGVDGFGKIAFAAAVMVWIQTIADWGFNYTATRDVAKNRNNINVVSKVFSNVLYSRLLLSIISFLFLILLVVAIPLFSENRDVLFVSFLMIPGHIFFPEWFFQAMEKMKYITIANVISKFCFTIAVFLFIHDKSDYILQPLFVSLGFVMAGIFSLYLILIKWRIKLLRPSFRDIYETIKASFNIFINTIMPNLYNSLSVVLLGFWGGAAANGIFDAGTKMINICQSFLSIIARTFFPYLSRSTKSHSLYSKLSISIAVFLSIVLFVLSPIIIKIIFTKEFEDSIVVLQICSLSLIFLTLTDVFGTNYLIVRGHEHIIRRITERGSVIGFFIALPLVYYFSYIGAAVVITMTRGLLGFWVMITANKIKKYE